MKKTFFIITLFTLLFIPTTAFARTRIEINIPSRILTVYNDNVFLKEYPIAVGKPSFDSPIGHYQVISKEVDPVWRPKGKKEVLPGPNNPLGPRWIGFFSEYGIHGNNNDKSIGTFASKGCIRMHNYDVEELYDMVEIGTPVDIYYNTFIPYKSLDKNKSTLIILPDLYSKNINKYSRIKNELDKMEIYNKIPQERMKALLKKVNINSVVFSNNWTLFINNEYISPKIILKQDTEQIERENLYKNLLVNIEDVNFALGLELYINENEIIEYKETSIYYETYEDDTYISIADCIKAIGGSYKVDDIEQKINWNINYGKVDGKYFKLDIKTTDKEVYASVRDIIDYLEITDDYWDDERRLLVVGDKEISGKIIDGRMYITKKQIKDYFGFDSKYFSLKNRLELF